MQPSNSEQSIFLAALDLQAGDERETYLRAACNGDRELLAKVQSLLSEHVRYADRREHQQKAETATYQPNRQDAGKIIGSYKLIQPIGEGGMGAVWLAEQRDPVKRNVALKLIKKGMDSEAVVARFEAERQALAVMDHSNIARIFDGGLSDDGSPYFVMELVRGLPITQFCDERKLTPQKRLELFIPVCQAIQHAHQKGIIHRDIKPSNVLVALYDDKPVPKIIDFGVAKATGHQSLTDRSLNTGFGAIVGTPEYMSPEQATLSNLDIDTRSDIYSLGVLLYELLVGETPFRKSELERVALMEVLRVIREVEPPRPSTKISTAEGAVSHSANRSMEPKQLAGILRRELDWIVIKSLEKDRSRRYESANAFAADIGRYLAGEKVLAHPPSKLYEWKKFLWKNRGLATATGVVFASLLAGIIGTSLGIVEATRQRFQADRARSEITSVNTQLERTNGALESQKVRALERESQAIEAVEKFRDALANEPLLKNTPALEELRIRLLREPLAFFQSLNERLQSDNEGHEESMDRLAIGNFNLGKITADIGNIQDAIKSYRAAVQLFQRLTERQPESERYRLSLSNSQKNLGNLFKSTGDLTTARTAYESSLAICEDLLRRDPQNAKLKSLVASAQDNLGELLRHTGDFAGSRLSFESALKIHASMPPDVAKANWAREGLAGIQKSYGLLMEDMGQHLQAKSAYESLLSITKELAAENPDVVQHQVILAEAYGSLGNLLDVFGDPHEKQRALEAALDIFKKLAEQYPTETRHRSNLAKSYANIALWRKTNREFPSSREAYESAIRIARKLTQENATVKEHWELLTACYTNYAELLGDIGDPTSQKAYDAAITSSKKLVADHPNVHSYQEVMASIYFNYGLRLHRNNEPDAAREELQKAISIQTRLATEHPDAPQFSSTLGSTFNNLATFFGDRGNFEQSRSLLRQAIVWQRKALALNRSHPTFRLAMRYHLVNLINATTALGLSEEAAEARRELSEHTASDPKLDGIEARLQEVIGGRAATDNPERLELAQRAFDTRRYTLAVRLFDEAIHSDPSLAKDRNAFVQYNAACAAMLAADGHGKNEPRPDEFAVTGLRSHAIAWLHAELEEWADVIENGSQQKGANIANLIHWREDYDLVGIRDAKTIDTFPDVDRRACLALWARLDELVESRLLKLLKGASCPDNSERLTLAKYAFAKMRYAGAAELLRKAVNIDPKLALDRKSQHLYNASCAATLAMEGKGIDAPSNDEAKSELRSRILQWLTSELAGYKKQLEKANAQQRGAIARILQHWQQDPDLVGVRDPAALQKMPTEDGERYKALWSEVDKAIASSR